MSYFSEAIKKSPFQANNESPSPFRYNPNTISKPICAKVPFGSTSRIDRSLNINNKSNQQIQHGINIEPYNQYDTIINQLSRIVPKSTNKSSAFISKTHRFQTKQKQQTPGPGQYTLRISEMKNKNISMKKSKSQRNHSLSSSNLRLIVPSIPSDHLGYKQDQANNMKKIVVQNNIEPHPGSYDIRTNLQTQKGIKWKKTHEKNKLQLTPGPGQYQNSIKKTQKAPVSSFKSNSKRFNQSKQKLNKYEPGPGSYNPLKIVKKSHSNNQDGNFNCKTARFQNSNKSSNIGPGQYFNSIKQRVKAKSVQNFKNNQLNTERYNQLNEQLNISLNKAKNINQKNNKNNKSQSAFKKTIFDEKNENPGPGQYVNTLGMNFKLHKQLFRKYNQTTLPKQKRAIFQISQNKYTPGPGAYQYKKQQEQKIQKGLAVYKKTQVINLKNYQQQLSPSPFDYGNFTNTISDKINKLNSKIILTDIKPFGTGQERFKHYKEQNKFDTNENEKINNEEYNSKKSQRQLNENILVYDQSNKKVKKLVMTTIKVKVPFGSSSSKMKQSIISQSPGKFYNREQQWVKKSHNIRSKIN